MKRPGQKRNTIQKFNRAEKILAKKASNAEITKILKEDIERAEREVKRQEALEWAKERITQINKQKRLFFVTTLFFIATTIIAGVL
jgi:type IV secretory pathway component VirB8